MRHDGRARLRSLRHLANVSVLAALGAAACSDSGAGPGPGATGGPLYVVAPWVFTGDDSTAYVTTVPSLEAGEVDLRNAIEYPNGAAVFGKSKQGDFYVAPFGQPIVERWSVAADGKFQKLGTVSFANLGIADAGGAQVLSQGKAYFLGGREIVVWDPVQMKFLKTVPLPSLENGNFDPSAGMIALGDDRLLVYLHWTDPEEWTKWDEHSTHVVFDTRTDSVVSSVDEARCEMLEPFGRKTTDGKTYFSSDPAYQLLERAYGPAHGTRSCGLRLLNADGTFDPTFALDPSSLVGGRPAGTVTMVSDDMAFIDVFHPELAGGEITPENVDKASNSAAYRFWTWRLGDAEAKDVVVQSPRTSSSLWQYVSEDGRVFVQDHTMDYGRWQLLELKPDGSVTPGLAGVGYATSGILRVR
jgi:hypothetical protein